MKTSGLLSLLPLAALSLFCLGLPAHAGQWVVTYETQGTNTGETVLGNYVVDEAWLAQSPNQFLFLDMTYPAWGEDEDNIHSAGNVTAVFTWTGGSGDNPPATLYVQETSSVHASPKSFPDLVYKDFSLVPVVAVSDDGLGDVVNHPYFEGTACSGRHLLEIATLGQRVIRLPQRHLEASISYADAAAYNGGLDGEYEEVQLNYSAATDNRAVTMTPLGHEITSHKVWKTDDSGNFVFANPLPQFPDATVQVAEPKVNTSLGSDKTLPVDVGLPIRSASSGGTGWYQIDYALLATPDFYAGDVWQWQDSLYGDSAGDTIQATSYDTTDIPNQTVKYIPPILNIDASHRTIAWYDADSTDLVDFNYTFASDQAKADAHLFVRFHHPDENWVSFKTYKQQDTDVQASQYETDPQWLSPQDGYTLTVTRPGSDYETLVTIGYGLGGAGLAVASAVTDGVTSAFLAAVGFDYGLNPPQAPVDSFTNSYAEFQTAATATQNGDTRITPASLAASATEADWGSCQFSVWHKVLNQYDYWVGDHYGGVGYTGQVYEVTQKPYSWPYEFHYQQLSGPSAPPAAR